MEYAKPSLTFDEQADLVISRGMICDRDDLIAKLQRVGYYRLSGYWFTFRNDDNSFKPNTRFSTVWDTYTFDRQLRLIVLDAVERLEIWLRTALAYNLSQLSGAFGYKDAGSLPNLTQQEYDAFMTKCASEHNRSKERFIGHFKNRYGDFHDLPPYWMLVGTMDFGQILTLYRGAPRSVQDSIASQVGVKNVVLKSWLVSLNTVRNVCAHHARLWNRQMGTKPMIPHDKRWHEPCSITSNRVFGTLSILSYLLEAIAPNTKWRERLFALLESYPTIPLKQMGFRQNWEKSTIWRMHIKA